MIKTFTGPMHSGKTAAMIMAYNKIWNKEHVLCVKPKKDTRDSGVIKSNDFVEKINAVCVESFEDIYNLVDDNIRSLFIDEVQMITGNVNILTYLSITRDLDIYIAGLNMTSEQQPFLIMPEILAISDEIEVIKASCYDCGRDASYTFFEGSKTESILVGDEGYVPLCSRCLKKRYGMRRLNKMVRGK